jgi:hypothetical protein
VLAIVMLFVGFQALGLQSQQVKPDMDNSTNLTKDTYNATDGIYTGLGNTLATALPWLGLLGIVAIAMGILYASGTGGR